jgi:GT2 family glycosyltransferase
VPDVSIIIINYNTRDLILGCLNSIFTKIKGIDYKVTVVDNGSSDGSIEAFQQNYPAVNLVRNERNLGFALAVNRALRNSPSDYCFILNSDTILTDDALNKLVSFLDNAPKAAIAGGQLLNQDGSRQNSFDNIPNIWSELAGKSLLRIVYPSRYPSKRQAYAQPVEVESVIGAAMLVRSQAIKEAGLLDEDYFLFLEETDWCHRMRQKGWQVWFVPDASIYHIQGQSKKQVLAAAKIEYINSLYKFYRKHYSLATYLLLRIIKPIKIGIALVFNLIALLITLGLSKSVRSLLAVQAALLWWHILLCP